MNDAATLFVGLLLAAACATALRRFPQFIDLLDRQNSRTKPVNARWFKLGLRLGLVGGLLIFAGRLQIFTK